MGKKQGHTRGLLAGKKFSGRHSTVIKDAEAILKIAKGREEVSRIVVSLIKPIRAGQVRLKLDDIDAGLKMTVRGTNAVQAFFIYTSDRELTRRKLTEGWEQQKR